MLSYLEPCSMRLLIRIIYTSPPQFRQAALRVTGTGAILTAKISEKPKSSKYFLLLEQIS